MHKFRGGKKEARVFILFMIIYLLYRYIVLRGIFRKWEGIVGTGWSGLRIGTGGGHL
jgi:hypothetical protein